MSGARVLVCGTSTPRETVALWLRQNYRSETSNTEADAVLSALKEAGYEVVAREASPQIQSAMAFYFIHDAGPAGSVELSLARAAWTAAMKVVAREDEIDQKFRQLGAP